MTNAKKMSMTKYTKKYTNFANTKLFANRVIEIKLKLLKTF